MSDRNALRIADGALIVSPRGMDRVWGFRSRIVVPLPSIAGVRVERHPSRLPTGWRGPGLDAFGKLSGTFHPRGERHYWNYSGRGDALVVDVSGGDPFDRLLLSVADAEASCAWLAEAVGRAR
ncbi:hypothetical protein D3248_03495 [Leucobacter zeae]|nr:hypothetical protein [Leucobacter zeae]